MTILGRVARRPLLHFALLGALLFAARHPFFVGADARPARDPIVIAPERARALADEFAERWGAPPNAAQRHALVAEAVQEEMLFREARVLALGLGDGSIRRRLVEKMRVSLVIGTAR